MKRIFSVLTIFCLLFSLSACEQSANMGTLLAYQSGDFRAEAEISLCGESYTAEIEKRGERITFRFKKPQGLSAFGFVFTQAGASISADGMEIPLCEGEFFRFSCLSSLFSVPAEGAWKIKRQSPGGVDVYLCKNGDTALYIDANSLLPLKISAGGTVADILRFEKE